MDVLSNTLVFLIRAPRAAHSRWIEHVMSTGLGKVPYRPKPSTDWPNSQPQRQFKELQCLIGFEAVTNSFNCRSAVLFY